ncbi:MAG: Fe(2+) transporter permease subunit FeoB [Chromatiaceae bacterium]
MSFSHVTIALVGNPNCGKTTLFNALTGARQTVGNWPGVTVERKSGHYRFQEREVEVVDLPGVYSMDAIPGATTLDQQVTHDFVLAAEANLIVNILDASNLERNLYLTTQLLELGRPLIIALNMVDAATKKGQVIQAQELSRLLDCPVVPMSASTCQGVEDLKALLAAARQEHPSARVSYPAVIAEAIAQLAQGLGPLPPNAPQPAWIALKLLEGDTAAPRLASPHSLDQAAALRRRIESELGEEIDILAADARYRFIGEIASQVVQTREGVSPGLTRALDRVILNRALGLPIFLGVMYLMFLFTINLGGAFIDFFDQLFGAFLVDGLGEVMTRLGSPDWLRVLIADGAGGGIQTVATFIPVIGFLFLFLSFLEDSGYMARAAFVIDRLMRALGLPGKSFVPLIVGFGCNVPAVMATRTLENPRDRLMTMAMTPFMSCGARLPVYALFAAAFFPVGGQNLVFLLYLIGVLVAVLTAIALRRTLLPGTGSHFIMELPTYHLPTLKGLLLHTWERLKGFILKAGRFIVPMVLALNVLNSLGTDGSFGHQKDDQSVLAAVGKAIVPAFAPIGLTADNWPAAVGIFTGILAKEAVVGTLDTLYSQHAAVTLTASSDQARPPNDEPAAVTAGFDLLVAVSGAFATIPENLAGLADAALDPLGLNIGDISDVQAAAATQVVDAGTFGAMARLFDGTAGAFAYLLLVLLYFPCVAVLGAVYREASLRWAAFIALWATGMGYGIATLYFQIATFALHPAQSLTWTLGITLTFGVALLGMKHWGERPGPAPIPLVAAT